MMPRSSVAISAKAIRVMSAAARPQKIALALGEPFPGRWPSLDGEGGLSALPPGRKVAAPEVLFRKVEDAQVAEWRERFGGPEAEVEPA
jgi:hypothetical protein